MSCGDRARAAGASQRFPAVLIQVSKGALSWKAYTEFVNDIVIDGFSNAILASLQYLQSQVDPASIAKNETAPLLEISLELVLPDIVWVPEIGVSSGGDGIRDMFNGWVTSMVNIGNLVKRLDGAAPAPLARSCRFFPPHGRGFDSLNAASTPSRIYALHVVTCLSVCVLRITCCAL